MRKLGFTLIELVLVIAILGILAISGLPRFLNLAGEAEIATMESVVGSVRSALLMYRSNDIVDNGGAGNFPATLDGEAPGGCTNCFSTILSNGLNDSSWEKSNNTTYIFNDGNNLTTFIYAPAVGTFD